MITFEYEVLTREEAESYFKRQIDETHIKPYVEFVSKFDVGEHVRIAKAVLGDGSTESVRTIKRNLNQAAKRRQKGHYVTKNGKSLIGPDNKPVREYEFNEDGTAIIEPVQLRWKADTHYEDKTENGKTEKVLIVDKLVMLLVASEPKKNEPEAPKVETPEPKSETPEPPKTEAPSTNGASKTDAREPVTASGKK